MNCIGCGYDLNENANFCPKCGKKVMTTCKKCGYPLAYGTNFCTRCGMPETTIQKHDIDVIDGVVQKL